VGLPQTGRTSDAWTPKRGTNPSLVQSSNASGTEAPLMAGRHRLKGRSVVQRTTRYRAIEVVDARTLTAHFLTLDALAAGRLPKGRYITLCGQDVLPASLAEPGRAAREPC